MEVKKGISYFDRFSLHYRLYGSSGPVIICVNGAYQTMFIWRSFIKVFSRDHRVLVFDFPGQGKSTIDSVPFVVSFEEQVKILGNMVDFASSMSKVFVFGLSWGGVVAAAYASTHPGKIEKLMLASFIVRANGKLRDIISRGKTMLYRGQHTEISELMIDGFGQGLSDNIKSHTQRQFREISDISLRAFDEYASLLDSIGTISDFIDLSKIDAETVIINSGNDPIVDSYDIEEITDDIPNRQIKIIENVGHFLHLENKNIFSVYRDFLTKRDPKHSLDRYSAAYLRYRL